jgi:D-alanine-D-alanine ligase
MKTVAVIFGGQSTEHDVSVITALGSVIKPLELSGDYNVEPVYISKDGSWYWDKKLNDVSLFSSGDIESFLKKAPKTQLLFDNGLTLVKSSQFAGRKQLQKIDVVFPAMHGTHGEDGELMGILEMAGVPYVGCGVQASVVSMDKVLTKQVTEAYGIPSTPWVWLNSEELSNSSASLKKCEGLKYPIFVKPARLGSSIGITRVEQKSQLMNALEVAAHYDDKIIVEQGVSNLIEVTLPIIGNKELLPASLEEPLLNSEDFFDFDTKYMNGGKKGGKKGGGKLGAQGYSNLPAKLPKDLYKKAEKLGLDVFKAVGCEGIARIDMLIDSKTGQVFFNEINPLPGDLYSHNWRATGVSGVELVSRLIKLAEERFTINQKQTTSFDTNFLKQF